MERAVQIDRRLISHFDWTLFFLSLVFVAVGVTTIYSANFDMAAGHAGPLPVRQVTWLGLGLIAMITAISFDYHYIDRLAYPFYGAMLLLLTLVLVIGHSGGGSQRWINLGFFRLQPSEPAKLAIVLVMAKYFQTDEPPRGYFLRDLWVPFALVGPLVILTLVQPDLGTAIILGIVFISMILMGGLRLRSFAYLVGAGLAFLPIGWHFLKQYQRNRILTFLDPDRDPLGAGYHVIQSQIAIGSGRLFGKGYLHGTQNRLDFLPAQHVAVFHYDRILPWTRAAGQGPLRRSADLRHDRHRLLACRDQRRYGRGSHARRRRSIAHGELWRLRSSLDDVRHRRHHERQHAAVYLLIGQLRT